MYMYMYMLDVSIALLWNIMHLRLSTVTVKN